MAEDHIPQGVSPAIFVFGKLFVEFWKTSVIALYKRLWENYPILR